MVAMLTALNASFRTWADEAAQTARLAPQTMVHGDFHGGNHLFNPHDACRVIDFQFFGTGRVADEVAYFFTMCVASHACPAPYLFFGGPVGSLNRGRSVHDRDPG